MRRWRPRNSALALLTLVAGASRPAAAGITDVAYDADRQVEIVASGPTWTIQSPGARLAPTLVTPAGLERGAVTMLAPRGGIVLGVVSGEDGTRSVTIHGVDGTLRGRIAPDRDRRFSGILIGGPGRTIATITVDPGPESAGWRWDVWSGGGSPLGTFSTPPGSKAGFDADGGTLLVVEPERAVVRDATGRIVGEPIAGRFHKGALSVGGRLVVLGDDGDRKRITVRAGVSEAKTVLAHANVYGLAVAPDGRSAWAWFGDGAVRAIDPVSASLLQPVRPSIESGGAFLTSLVAEDGGKALVAFATRTPGAPSANGGLIERVDTRRVLWRVEFPTAVPTAFLPRAIAAGRKVIAWNRERAQLLDPAVDGTRP